MAFDGEKVTILWIIGDVASPRTTRRPGSLENVGSDRQSAGDAPIAMRLAATGNLLKATMLFGRNGAESGMNGEYDTMEGSAVVFRD
jgi:hypothetical protein